MENNSLFNSIRVMAESLQVINQRAVLEYTPIIQNILDSCSREKNYIEHTLDGLLGFCGYEPALVLYKKLCRHYWHIDPAATASYIYAYREMWEPAESMQPSADAAAPERRSPMESAKKTAARRNVKKAVASAKRKRTIANLPKKTRTALGK